MYKKFVPIYIAVFILGFAASYGVLSKTIRKTTTTSPTPSGIGYGNVFDSISDTDKQAEGTFNAVLLGGGGAGHSGGGLTDSIIVINVDAKNNKAKLISVPRDLWVPGNRKLNADVVNVGYEGLKSTLQGITGLKINKFASIDFGSMVKMIDTMGEITVNNLKVYDDYFYPIKGLENELCGKSAEEVVAIHQKYSGFELEKQFACRYEHIHFDQGQIQINGANALKFARSRHGDSDFGRSQRQFSILRGVISKLSTQSPFKSIEDAYNTLVGFVKTDLSLSEALTLFDLYGNPEKYTVSEIQLTTANVLSESKSSNGQYILTPKAGNFNFGDIKTLIGQ